jgi:hypothetical protein
MPTFSSSLAGLSGGALRGAAGDTSVISPLRQRWAAKSVNSAFLCASGWLSTLSAAVTMSSPSSGGVFSSAFPILIMQKNPVVESGGVPARWEALLGLR